MEVISREEAFGMFLEFIDSKKSQAQAARELGISGAYLYDVIKGRKNLGPIMDRLGWEKQVEVKYRRKG